jgi:threonyl-tRNA synthetase
LIGNGFRVSLDDRSEKIGYKIREGETQKTPYMLILGEREVQSGTISIRQRRAGDIGSSTTQEFIEKLRAEEIAKQ